jgi:hypothetical protein
MMGIQICCGHSGRRWLAECVVVTAVLAAACGRDVPWAGDQPHALDAGFKIEDVLDVRTADSGLIVQYRTRTSVRDCPAQAGEMPQVWKLVVREHLTNSAIQKVFMSPAEASGQSVAIAFTKNASGRWTASAPCSIRIPAS